MKYRHHKYTWEKSLGVARHAWSLVGPLGGVHFTFYDHKDTPSAGLEFHHSPVCDYRRNEAPDHVNCWLIGGPCRHDGSSLYARETLLPMILPMIRNGDHGTIFRFLEGEADQHFQQFTQQEGQ